MAIEPRHPERGAMRMGCLVAAAAVVLLVLIFGGLLVGRYNNLVNLDERAQAAWSEIDNQYKRRFDLIPQLVATVQGAARAGANVLVAGSALYRDPLGLEHAVSELRALASATRTPDDQEP